MVGPQVGLELWFARLAVELVEIALEPLLVLLGDDDRLALLPFVVLFATKDWMTGTRCEP